MNTNLLFDKFAYVDRLRHAGVDEALARAHGDGLEQALREEVATKSDIAEVKSVIVDVKAELKGDIAALRSEMQLGFAQVDVKFAQVDTKLEKALHDQTFKIVSLMGGLLGILAVVLHFWK